MHRGQVQLLSDTSERDARAVRSASPHPEDEAHLRAALLVQHLGFTPDEAARYVAGDRSAMDAVTARRVASAFRANADETPG